MFSKKFVSVSLASFLMLGVAGCTSTPEESDKKEVAKEVKEIKEVKEVKKTNQEDMNEKLIAYMNENEGIKGKITSFYRDGEGYILTVNTNTMKQLEKEIEKMKKEFEGTKLVFEEKDVEVINRMNKEAEKKLESFVKKVTDHGSELVENGISINRITYNKENDKISLVLKDDKQSSKELLKKISQILEVDADSIEFKAE